MKTQAICLAIFLIGIQALIAGGSNCDSVRPGHKIKLKDGRILHYRQYGNPDGRLVLWFHGLNSASREPEVIEKEIKRAGLRVVCIDRPGIGKSTFSCDREILDWADDVTQLVDKIGCGGQHFGIIATSGGSSYGCACAIKLRHRVSHLALVSPFSPVDAPCVKQGNVTPLVRIATNHPNIAKASIKSAKAKLERNPDQMMKRAARRYSAADVELVYGNQCHYQRRIDVLHDVLAQGPCGIHRELALHGSDWGFKICQVKGVPVTIWSGGDDPITPPSMACYFKKQISGSRLYCGKDDGHSSILYNKARSILSQF